MLLHTAAHHAAELTILPLSFFTSAINAYDIVI